MWVVSGFEAAFAASFCWMLGVSRMELGKAYPFMALNFGLTGLFAASLFGEAYSLEKGVGLAFIVVGIVISSQG
jgi:multidrug transporter EmrE-like cation transporter